MSSGEVASICGSDFVNISGPRIKENLRSLFYFGSADILKVKVIATTFIQRHTRDEVRPCTFGPTGPQHQVECVLPKKYS